jgi:hypothetical protein
MAFTKDSLTSAIQDYVESSETSMVAMIPQFMKTTERTIVKATKLPEFRKNQEGNMTATSRFLTLPTDCLAVYSLAVTNGTDGRANLLNKDVAFIQEAYPDTTVTGQPRYYAVYDDDTVILGPVPGSSYACELNYLHIPASLDDGAGAGTTWLSTNAENAMLYGCLVEAYTYLKGEQDLIQLYQTRFQQEIMLLKGEGEGFTTTDETREGVKSSPQI